MQNRIIVISAIVILYVTVTILTSGCIPKLTNPKVVNCDPPPAPVCKPSEWIGSPIDTTINFAQKNGYYFTLKPVQRVNSPDDEWQMTFQNDKNALLTFSERGRQSAMLTRKIRHDSYDIESGVINPIDMHTGVLSTKHGRALFAASPREPVTKNISDTVKIPVQLDFTGKSRIYEAKIFGRELSEINRLTEIEPDDYSWDSQPAYFPDGKSMVFVSDRDGGEGYADLWFTFKTGNGTWSAPVNLGNRINSTCDDLTPFITLDGKFLLFASSGYSSVGGYDLFKSQISDSFYKDLISNRLDTANIGKYFLPPENLKPPINSKYDELFPSSPGDIDSLLYFSSDRANKENLVVMLGGFDIYVFCKEMYSNLQPGKSKELSTPDIALKPGDVTSTEPVIDFDKMYILEGSIYREGTKEVISGAEVTAKSSDGYEKNAKTGVSGKYSIDLIKGLEFEVTARADKYFHDSYKIRMDSDDSAKILAKDFYLPVMLSLRINFPTDEYQNPYKYTLDSNGVETGRTWQEELKLIAETILISKDKIQKIILSGHTDDVASEEYNQKLGERRVNFVISELILLGVPETLLEGRSAGELEPLNRRKSEDISTFRKRLRRVTIEKILKD